MISKKALNVLLTGVMAVSVVGVASMANAQNGNEKEKCYGVVKASKNDCASASGSHSCHAAATADGMGDEWIAVPKGLCERLANGSLTPVSGGGSPSATGVINPIHQESPPEVIQPVPGQAPNNGNGQESPAGAPGAAPAGSSGAGTVSE